MWPHSACTRSRLAAEPMSQHRSIRVFAERPLASVFLAVLMLCLGVVFVSGFVPTSLNRPYFPGHQ